jgi:hypothetical protein
MGDLDCESGRLLTRRALEFMEVRQPRAVDTRADSLTRDLAQNDGKYARLGFIHIASGQSAQIEGPRLSTFIYQALTTQTLSILKPSDLLGVIDEIDGGSEGTSVSLGKIMDDVVARSPGGRPLDVNDLFAVPSALTLAGSRGFWNARAAEARSIPVGETGLHILVNGRVSFEALVSLALYIDSWLTVRCSARSHLTSSLLTISLLWRGRM